MIGKLIALLARLGLVPWQIGTVLVTIKRVPRSI